MSRTTKTLFSVLLAALLIPGIALAAPKANISASGVSWQAASEYDGVTLVVSGPSGAYYTKEFTRGQAPSFSLKDIPANLAVDGTYTFELRYTPRLSADVKKALADARERGDDGAATQILKDAGVGDNLVQSGVFSVQGGSFVTGGNEGQRTQATNTAGGLRAGSDAKFKATTDDQVIADDLIVQGSACVGLDCVNNESFGFDTIRLKENNTRIKFDDTSTSAGFAANDWQLTANDSASGGSSKFSIEDITGSKVPFTVTAGASTNSIFVDSTGRVGFRTSTPVLDLHVATSNTPAMRLEQNNSGGFTAQTWDIAGNEANFFVRDVTSGSRLPFRIRPGAPTSSIDINANGEVGIGVASAEARLHVDSTSTNNPGAGTSSILVKSANNTDALIGFGAGPNFADNTDGFILGYNGNAGVGRAFVGTRPTTGTGEIAFAVKNVTEMKLTSTGLEVTDAIRVGGVTMTVPDFVFEPGYNLMSLDALKTFITTNKHLPDIPSEKEIKKNGVDIGGFNMNLLQKVEELTLYTVAQHETIQKLEERLAQLEKALNKQ